MVHYLYSHCCISNTILTKDIFIKLICRIIVYFSLLGNKMNYFLGASNSSGGNTSRDSNRDRDRGDRGGYHHGNSNNLGLAAAQLLAKPEALTTALTTLASLSSLGSLGGGLLAGLGGSGSGHVTGVHRRGGGNYSSGSRSSRDEERGSSRDSKRSKFAPY